MLRMNMGRAINDRFAWLRVQKKELRCSQKGSQIHSNHSILWAFLKNDKMTQYAQWESCMFTCYYSTDIWMCVCESECRFIYTRVVYYNTFIMLRMNMGRAINDRFAWPVFKKRNFALKELRIENWALLKNDKMTHTHSENHACSLLLLHWDIWMCVCESECRLYILE